MAQTPVPIILMDLYFGALQVARLLGRKGIPVYGVDKSDHPIAEKSRYIKGLYTSNHDTSLIQHIISFYSTSDVKPVIMPMSDYYVLFIAEHHDVIKEYCLTPYENPRALVQLVSKKGLLDKFNELQVNAPKSMVIQKGSLRLPEGMDLTFPCILKPDYHDNWADNAEARSYTGNKRVTMIRDMDHLEEAIKVLSKYDHIILQEYIPGDSPSLYYYVGHRNKKGHILTAQLSNKVRTYPEGLGSETLLNSVNIPELLNYCNDLLHKLNYIGPAGIDIKYDRRDDTYKIIEINCRLGLNDCYMADYGVDPAYVYYLDSLGKDVTAQLTYPSDITWYDLSRDIEWVQDNNMNGCFSWRRWIFDLITGYDSYELFDWTDPGPFLQFWYNKIVGRLGKMF